MELPPPHALACRIAGALLLLLAAWQAAFTVAFAGRFALVALDPTAAWPLTGGLGGAAAAGAAGLAVAGLSAAAGVLLLARPSWGRWLGGLVALAWLPLGCGVVGVALLVLVTRTDPYAAPASSLQRRDRATSA